jgi:hypothetical protein
VAAIGSSALTGAVGFGTIWWQQRKRDKAAAVSEMSETYHQLIAHSLSFVIRARTLRNAIQARSGLREGLDVTLGIRPPLDPFEFHDWFAQGFEPINQAWSKIEMIGSPEAVEAATQVLDACADIVAMATQPGAGRGKIATTLGGVQWTAEQEHALEAVAKRVLKHRREFIRIARADLSMPVVSPATDLAAASAADHRMEATSRKT